MRAPAQSVRRPESSVGVGELALEHQRAVGRIDCVVHELQPSGDRQRVVGVQLHVHGRVLGAVALHERQVVLRDGEAHADRTQLVHRDERLGGAGLDQVADVDVEVPGVPGAEIEKVLRICKNSLKS